MTPTGTTRTRTVQWEDPMPHVSEGMTRRPLDYLRDMVEGTIPVAPIAALLGITGLEIEEGRTLFAVDPAEYHYNPLGTVHGGVLATLLDSAMGCAVHSTLPEGGYFTTLELKVNFVRAVTGHSGRITCEGKVIHVGRTVATAEARAWDGRERVVAHGTTTCLLHRAPA